MKKRERERGIDEEWESEEEKIMRGGRDTYIERQTDRQTER